MATVYRFLVFDKEGDRAEVKDGFGVPWYSGNVDRSSGFYGSKKERIHMSTQVQLEVGGRGTRTRTHIGSQQRGGRPGK